MGVRSVVAVGLCIALFVTVALVVRSSAIPGAQVSIPNVNPQVERRFRQLRQKEEGERMDKDNRQDAQKIVSLAAELKQYGHSENGAPPADAVRKAEQVAKLARRLHDRLRESALRLPAR